AFLAAFAAYSGLFEPAERHAEFHPHAVLSHHSGAALPADVIRRRGGAGADALMEAIIARIGHADRLFRVLRGQQALAGTEGFVRRNAALVVDIGKEGWLDEIALVHMRRALAAGDEIGAGFAAFLDIHFDPLELALHRQRSELGFRIL